jgi:hypothetical protein
MLASPMQLFTMVPRHWYAAELIGDAFGDSVRSYSPIRVDGINPLGTGSCELLLDFFHANYPEGVRSNSYRLQVLERQTRFVLARSLDHTPTQLLLVYEPTWDWLKRHFDLANEDPNIDLQIFMEQRCR